MILLHFGVALFILAVVVKTVFLHLEHKEISLHRSANVVLDVILYLSLITLSVGLWLIYIFPYTCLGRATCSH